MQKEKGYGEETDRSDVNLEQHLTRSPVKDYFVFIFSSFIIFQYIKQHTVGGGGGGVIWSPADFVRFPPDKEIISIILTVG